MNCRQVEPWLVDFARGIAAADDAAADAQHHLAACAHCAARLTAEQRLSAAFSAVVQADAEAAAPAHVEAMLRAAFRTQIDNEQTQTTRASVLAPRGSLASALWTRRTWAALVVAGVVALLVVAVVRLRFTPSRPVARTVAHNQSHEPVAPSSQPLRPPAHEQQAEQLDVSASSALPDESRRGVRLKATRVRRGTQAHEHEAAPASVGSVGEMLVVARAPASESVSEFVSLVAGSAPPLASGQLVRVELPRSALASLGLPLNPARGGETIKADVLLGDDGLARAIRFVR